MQSVTPILGSKLIFSFLEATIIIRYHEKIQFQTIHYSTMYV
jgi:hypothetical protein